MECWLTATSRILSKRSTVWLSSVRALRKLSSEGLPTARRTLALFSTSGVCRDTSSKLNRFATSPMAAQTLEDSTRRIKSFDSRCLQDVPARTRSRRKYSFSN
eukprot:693536-Pyramimonas_sp.AAC.2